jgi:hypothetical protein
MLYIGKQYLSTGMNAVLCGCTIRIANIQSDVKGVTAAQEIEVHLKQVIFIL